MKRENQMIDKCNQNLKEVIEQGDESLIAKINDSSNYDFTEQFGNDDDKIFDRFTHYDWMNILNMDQKEHASVSQINRINF